MKSHLAFTLLLPLLFFSVDALLKPPPSWGHIESCRDHRPFKSHDVCYDYVYARVRNMPQAEGVCARAQALHLVDVNVHIDYKKKDDKYGVQPENKIFCKYMSQVTCAASEYVMSDRCYWIPGGPDALYTRKDAYNKCQGTSVPVPEHTLVAKALSHYLMKHLFEYATKRFTKVDYMFIYPPKKDTDYFRLPGRINRTEFTLHSDETMVVRLSVNKEFADSQRGYMFKRAGSDLTVFQAPVVCSKPGTDFHYDWAELQNYCKLLHDMGLSTFSHNKKCYFLSRNLYKSTRDNIWDMHDTCRTFSGAYQYEVAFVTDADLSGLNPNYIVQRLHLATYRKTGVTKCNKEDIQQDWESFDSRTDKVSQNVVKFKDLKQECTDFEEQGSTVAGITYHPNEKRYYLDPLPPIDARPILCAFSYPKAN